MNVADRGSTAHAPDRTSRRRDGRSSSPPVIKHYAAEPAGYTSIDCVRYCDATPTAAANVTATRPPAHPRAAGETHTASATAAGREKWRSRECCDRVRCIRVVSIPCVCRQRDPHVPRHFWSDRRTDDRRRRRHGYVAARLARVFDGATSFTRGRVALPGHAQCARSVLPPAVGSFRRVSSAVRRVSAGGVPSRVSITNPL